jgi:hypothetical protein
MAYYTTPDEVQAIMKSNDLTDDQIDPYIRSAHLFILRVFSGDTTTSADTLVDIEKWFTAHIIATIYDRPTSSEVVGDAQLDYADRYADGLASTTYGRMVMMLDPTGKIASAGKKAATIDAVKSTKYEHNRYTNW